MHRELEQRYRDAADVVFLHLQTVWEAPDRNTPEAGGEEARRQGIRAPVGYDAHVDGEANSVVMNRFGTGGTPWTLVIDPAGVVRMSEFTPDVEKVAGVIDRLRKP